MTDARERMARALCVLAGIDPDSCIGTASTLSPLPHFRWQLFLDEADAALDKARQQDALMRAALLRSVRVLPMPRSQPAAHDEHVSPEGESVVRAVCEAFAGQEHWLDECTEDPAVWRDNAIEMLLRLRAAGFVVVPVVATPAMLNAAETAPDDGNLWSDTWAAMLTAAPRVTP